MFTFHKYYFRIIGFAMAGAGAGMMLDELIHGPFKHGLCEHEFWGLIMVIAGAMLITEKPHGKD